MPPDYPTAVPGNVRAVPVGIALGPDGRVWFTAVAAGRIGTLTTSGEFATYPWSRRRAAPWSSPRDRTRRCGSWRSAPGRWAGSTPPAGSTRSPARPIGAPARDRLRSDGRLWFTEWGLGRVGCVDAAGRVQEHDLGGTDTEPHGVTVDASGVVWVALEVGEIARLAVT